MPTMIRTQLTRRMMALVLLAAATATAQAADTLRPEVGKPLQAAATLLKAKHAREALTKLGEADAVAGKTAYESFMIERMRASAAQQAGDTATAAGAYEKLIDSGKLAPAEQDQMIAALAGADYQLQRYPQASQWAVRYLKTRSGDPQMTTLLLQSYYMSGDCRSMANELHGVRSPAETSLQLLANCYLKQHDSANYLTALERLTASYPSAAYWSSLLRQVQSSDVFADRLALDVYRLKRAAGVFGSASDYMEMAQLALAGGYPAEAGRVLDQGFASGVLGNGDEAARQQRLREMARKNLLQVKATAAQQPDVNDPEAALDRGFDMVLGGQPEAGLPLMEQGVAQGRLKRPDDVKLHLAIAYYLAGQKVKAVQMFKTVKGEDGTADLARLWMLRAQSS
jgi:tetratricopeptide (TPR) repeat protein